MSNATAAKPRQQQSAPAAPPQSGAVAVVQPGGAVAKPEPSFAMQLKDKASQFQAALPAQIPVERFMRVVLTAVQRNPELLDGDRASLFTSSLQAASDGLLPDGREGALVIYKTKVVAVGQKDRWIKKVQWLPMVAGIRKKVRNSGEIADWNTAVVHAKDEFAFELGDEAFIRHKPFMGAGDPGPVIAAYSIAKLKGGELSREIMTRPQLDKVRAASKSPDTGPWKGWFEEMCRKTVAKRHSKVLPMSTDLDDLMRRDEALYDMEGAGDKAVKGERISMASRLDALADMRDPDPIPQAEEVDAETGEVLNQETSPQEGGTEGAAGQDGEAKPAMTPREAVVDKLMPDVVDGKNVPKLLNALPAAERDLLTDEDVARLKQASAAAAAKENASG